MEILATVPLQEESGLPLDQTITLTFDQEVDFHSLSGGGVVITTQAKKLVSYGPGMEDFVPVDDAYDILRDEVFRGFVEFELTTEDNITFTLTPKYDLAPITTFDVIISDRVVSKTVETLTAVALVGAGDIVAVTGPYTGIVDDLYTISITKAGGFGVGKFRYVMDSNPLFLSQEYVLKETVDIGDGLTIEFADESYAIGDIWTVTLLAGVPLDSIVRFSFSTGTSVELEVPRSERSISLEEANIDGITRIGSIISGGGDAPQNAADSLRVIGVDPEDLESNVALGRNIRLTFNKDIDPLSVTNDTVAVYMETLPFEHRQESTKLRTTVSMIDARTLEVRFIG